MTIRNSACALVSLVITLSCCFPTHCSPPSPAANTETPVSPTSESSPPPSDPADAASTAADNSTPAGDPKAQPASPASTPSVLQGSAEFREYLPPLDKEWRAGTQFNPVILKKLTPNNVWHRIPPWASGKWKMDQFTTFSFHQLKEQWRVKGLSRSRVWRVSPRLGFQKDRDGGTWEFDHGDYIGVAHTEDGVAIGFVKQREILESTDSRLVTHQVGTMIEVNSKTKVISKSTQYEAKTTSTRAGNGLLKQLCIMREFDEDGKPDCEYQNVSFLIQVAPFTPIDFYDGRDMWALFQEYLETHNMNSLVPAQHAVGLVAKKFSPSEKILQLLTEKTSRQIRSTHPTKTH